MKLKKVLIFSGLAILAIILSFNVVSAQEVPQIDVALYNSPIGPALDPGQLDVSFVRFRISATSAPVSINAIEIGSDSEYANSLSNIKLLEFDTTSNGYTLIGSNVENFTNLDNGVYKTTFVPNSSLLIENGSSKEFLVVADLGEAQGDIRLGITWLVISGDFTLLSELPVWGNTFTVNTPDPLMFSFESITGMQGNYTDQPNISLSVRGIHPSGMPTTIQEGFNVSGTILDSNMSTISTAYGSYTSNGDWNLNMQTPEMSTNNYNLRVTLWCVPYSYCTTIYGNSASVNSVYRFTVLPPTDCVDADYSNEVTWDACQEDGTRTGTRAKINSCIGDDTITVTGECTYVPPVACTYVRYSNWAKCTDGATSRTIKIQRPAGCVVENPILNKSCVSQTVIKRWTNKVAFQQTNKNTPRTLWYIDRTGKKMEILTDDDAQIVLTEIVTGISDEDLDKILLDGEQGNRSFGNKHKRRYFISVTNGERWYVKTNGRRILIDPLDILNFFSQNAQRISASNLSRLERR